MKELYLCPVCGSPSVEFSVLVGGNASCKACDWKGSKDELLSTPVHSEAGDQERVLLAIQSDLRSIFGRTATDWARFLVKWGFVSHEKVPSSPTPEINRKELASYLTVMGQAVLRAVFDHRASLEEARVKRG